MIGRAYSYKGFEADAARLHSHLWKSEEQRPVLVETRNLFVRDSAEGMSVMIALKAASKATIAFWHIVVSPRKTLSDAEAAAVVDLILIELKAQSHPVIVLGHQDKPRARPGGGGNHFHVVLGHVSPTTFRALDMRNHAPRLHKVWAIASFRIEGIATASPFHATIVEHLRAEGNVAVADWLVDELGEAPRLNAPPMTDSMRRSAAVAGFALPSFQAGVQRLWSAGASQAELMAFLESHDVIVRAGRSRNRLVLYWEDLFVGALHRILREDALAVRREAACRYPALLDTGAAGISRDRTPFPAPSAARIPAIEGRRLNLRRQRRIDEIEVHLSSVRWERLHHMYVGPREPRPAFAFPRNGKSSPDRGRRGDDTQTTERQQPGFEMGTRIGLLLRAEAVLEAAVAAVWEDDRWISAPLAELLRWAQVKLKHSTPGAPAADGAPEGRPDGEDETPPTAFLR